MDLRRLATIRSQLRSVELQQSILNGDISVHRLILSSFGDADDEDDDVNSMDLWMLQRQYAELERVLGLVRHKLHRLCQLHHRPFRPRTRPVPSRLASDWWASNDA